MAVWTLPVEVADTCIRLIAKAVFAGEAVSYVPGLCKAIKFVALTVLTLLFMALSWPTIIDIASRKLQPPPNICSLL